MIPELRKRFNEQFTEEKYKSFLNDLNNKHPDAIEFRVAETPVFVPGDFSEKMIEACEAIVDVILEKDFIKLTDRAIPENDRVPGEEGIPEFIAFDFGVCINQDGEPEPQLIEMQGFPSLFAFQAYYPEVIRKHFEIPQNFSQYLDGHNRENYIDFLKKIILKNYSPEEVILLELKPHQQKTRIDFYCTQDFLGIPIICLTELIQEGKNLYYEKDGKKIQIKRIYNRVIFDELHQMKDQLGNIVDITQPLNVEWAPHPNWFYRISKFTLPFIQHPYVPETFFLSDVKQLPADLSEFVLKPLFSFAGQGVIIDVTKEDIEIIKDPQNWILQKKVKYADIIQTPNEPAKAEIRIFYFWDTSMSRPRPVCNLARLSKGKMIGVRYNVDKDWVGGSVGFFEKD